MAAERYERFHLPARDEKVSLTRCKGCGTLVFDTAQHDRLHEGLDRLWKTAEALSLRAIGES